MSKIVVIANQKGGVAKTTTAVNLAAFLGSFGKNVLLIDLDPQGNASSGIGLDRQNVTKGIYEVLIEKETLESTVLPSLSKGVSICPAQMGLVGAELELVYAVRRDHRLKEALNKNAYKNRYDFVIIDTPPSLGLLTLNAFTAADSVLIPMQCEYYALEGLAQLYKTIHLVKQKTNLELTVEGIVFSMVDPRVNLTLQVMEEVRKNLKDSVYETAIPRNVRLAEAPSFGKSILDYDKTSKGAEAYEALAKEFLRRNDVISAPRMSETQEVTPAMRSALGKGINALFSEGTVAAAEANASTQNINTPLQVSIAAIHPNPHQPRKFFSEEALNELAASIREHGVLQPILVSPSADGTYEIIAGERRWRAAQRAGLSEMPVIVKSGTETQNFSIALIENIQRADLNAIELAKAYKRLHDDFHMTQEDISKSVGKDRGVIANTLRLLSLAPEIQIAVEEGTLSAAHARTLAGLEDFHAQRKLFKQIVDQKLTVRAVEQAVRTTKQVNVQAHVRTNMQDSKPTEVRTIEEDLQRVLTRKVQLHETDAASHKGWLKLEFYSLDDLDALLSHLKKKA